MRTLATALVSALTTAALVAPVTTAEAAPVSSSTITTRDVAARPAPLKMKTSPRAYSHYGQEGVKVTAITGKGTRGKVTFILNGEVVDKKKIKKGKASYRLDASLAPGKYVVKAKYKTRKGKTSVRVFNSSLSLNAVEFTVSQAAYCSQSDPVMSGQVIFKDQTANDGYVDIYRNGNIKGGSQSPDFVTFESVQPGGGFEFGMCDSLWSEVKDYGPGTYQFKALYTPDADYEDYIYSSWITIHVVP